MNHARSLGHSRNARALHFRERGFAARIRGQDGFGRGVKVFRIQAGLQFRQGVEKQRGVEFHPDDARRSRQHGILPDVQKLRRGADALHGDLFRRVCLAVGVASVDEDGLQAALRGSKIAGGPQ